MNRIDLPENIKICVIQHLEIVSAEFRSYFSDDRLHVSWYSDLFLTLKLTLMLKKQRSWQS